MEKKITGKNPSPDRDDMELKRHLEAAFETDNFVVSEDLIQRTLSRIREAGTFDTDNAAEDAQKKKRFPVKRFAGAAAAVFILATAVWAYQNNMTGEKMDSGSLTAQDKSYTMQAIESAEPSQTADAGTGDNGSASPKAAEGTAGNADQTTGADERKDISFSMAKEAPGTGTDLPSLKGADSSITVSAIEKDDIQSFILLNQEGSQQQMSVDSAVKLYDLLGNYTIQAADTKPSGKYVYCFVVTSKEEKKVTYQFYKNSILDVTDERAEDDTVTYTVTRGEDLLSKLENLIKE
ncbi:hypothetical protein [Anaerocolumna xylanovorans]|uniref:DUF4367 domain-containing protein n=1 Tax=Anaerocolumna xylanovorans DSM 12503 TaxID=1121345 RepID=A0A1M7Y892_9FIRM|nr:hypothetical protein [Anaerocolumna xylanovorans]SHO48853.1 hypothetical protein SAMN02745217_02063 [Anaerocolumna xylanovorans DSM 12503]